MNKKELTISDFLKYEVYSSKIANLFYSKWWQDLMSIYYARKTTKKFLRYKNRCEVKKQLNKQ